MTDDNARQSGGSDTGDAHTRRAQVDEVPDRRRCRAQVRIVCEQRFAGDRALAAHDPIVAGCERVSVETDAVESRGRDLRIVREFRECLS